MNVIALDKMRAVFRVDASINIGAGHLMRCKTIAHFLKEKNWDCTFLLRKETENFLDNDFIENFKYRFLECSNEFELKEIKSLIDFKPDLMIIDSYDWDYTKEKKLHNFTKKLIVIDDLANRKHDCDILLDQTYKRRKSDYTRLVGYKTKILNGTKFAILRKEFRELREKALNKKIGYVKNILISIGSIDNENLIIKILRSFEVLNTNAFIYIAINKNTPNLKKIQKYILASNLKIHLILNCNNMAEMMLRADLAIGAAGTSVWERCCMGLPTIQFVRADNQKQIAKSLAKDDIAVNIEKINSVSVFKISDVINSVINDKTKRKNLFHKSLNLCDGLGIKRFFEELVK